MDIGFIYENIGWSGLEVSSLKTFEHIGKLIKVVLGLVSLGIIYWISRVNYLLFHATTEFFSIIIAMTIFIIIYNGRKYVKNNYLMIIGMAYLFVGIFDFLHVLGFKGMRIFTDYDYYANQLWIAGRFFESVMILLAVVSVKWRRMVSHRMLLAIMTVVVGLVLISIFPTDIFPECFVEGYGQTNFKIIGEYVVIAILALAAYLVYRYRGLFGKDIVLVLEASIILTIISELCFTLYNDNYGVFNMLGHLFKIVSFYYIYHAMIVKVIREPYDTIFKELSEMKDRLGMENEALHEEINADPLTGVYNHGYMLERIRRETIRCKDKGGIFSLLFIDIDDFKEVNDHFGHKVGDQVIKDFAGILKDHCRHGDYVGRVGGDEFLMLLLDTNIHMAQMIAERVSDSVRDYDYNGNEKITASIGVKEYGGEEADILIELVDQQMYSAKRNGKNQISF